MIDPDEIFVRIAAANFFTGFVVRGDRVVAAADIVHYMARRRWTAD